MYREPDVLFFDEGPANFDVVNEAAIAVMFATLAMTVTAQSGVP